MIAHSRPEELLRSDRREYRILNDLLYQRRVGRRARGYEPSA